MNPLRSAASRRVAVVAEFNLTADALRVALSKRGFQVMSAPVPGTRGQVRALDHRFRAFRPRVAVLMQEVTGPVDVTNVTHTLESLRQTRWVLLTATPEGPFWGAGLVAGAVAVLPMSISVTELVDSLDALFQDEEVMPAEEKERLIALWSDRGAAQRDLVERLASLTRREMQVLEELSEGHSAAQIAASRGVTVGTVRSQVKSILRKLGVSSQLAAVATLQRAVDPVPKDAS